MLQLPENLTAEQFLAQYWQKKPLFMLQAAEALRPTVTRNELAWLATLEDVESRIVFTDRGNKRTLYRVETGPFDTAFLQALPKRDWTLLVHDVDKHLPTMRRLFKLVPFIPDWRIDDLMVSFAAPGGGVGPHRDKYDVFLFQGIGIRDWHISEDNVAEDNAASGDLALLQEFAGDENHVTRSGDVLYLPPDVAHWGTARRACITYSIGMRAPPGYRDPDLQLDEVGAGYIAPTARKRAEKLTYDLGCEVTAVKEWLRPIAPTAEELDALLDDPVTLQRLQLHGMARVAFDDSCVYVNGEKRTLEHDVRRPLGALCRQRRLDKALAVKLQDQCLRWLLAQGAFALPEKT